MTMIDSYAHATLGPSYSEVRHERVDEIHTVAATLADCHGETFGALQTVEQRVYVDQATAVVGDLQNHLMPAGCEPAEFARLEARVTAFEEILEEARVALVSLRIFRARTPTPTDLEAAALELVAKLRTLLKDPA